MISMRYTICIYCGFICAFLIISEFVTKSFPIWYLTYFLGLHVMVIFIVPAIIILFFYNTYLSIFRKPIYILYILTDCIIPMIAIGYFGEKFPFRM
jgi:hypothetical protein